MTLQTSPALLKSESTAYLNSPTSSDESGVASHSPNERTLMMPSGHHGNRSGRPMGPSSGQAHPGPYRGGHDSSSNLLQAQQGAGARPSVGTTTSRSASSTGKAWQRPQSAPRGTLSSECSSQLDSNGIPVEPYYDHDPGRWHTDQKEEDDYLHDVTKADHNSILSGRGLMNVGMLVVIILILLMMFMGYPMLQHFYFSKPGNKGGFGLGGSNGTGQVPDLDKMGFRWELIDKDTPKSAHTKTGLGPGSDETWRLQFSDEFETPGRSFYPGDDPFWEAVDLYAHGTADYEWYDPAAVTTRDGAMWITCTQQDIHDLKYRSGQVTTWNKFCYTGGYLEAAVILPGSPKVSGWWPAIWTMGNLGRANYGATTEGMWPYSYDSCDRGTLANQTDPDGLGPPAALQSGGETMFNDKWHTTSVSWQPGQRLSACTCDGEDHPGPRRKDGSYVGRSAPELDLFEAQIDGKKGGTLSLSGQFMPANSGYWLNNASGNEIELFEVNGDKVELNSYRGNILQQSASGIVTTNQRAYELADDNYSIWGFEYEQGDDGYVTWWIDGVKAWTLRASAVGPDAKAGISQRPIPPEPMYIIMNLALSSGFGYVDWDKLVFPAHMKVDYIRLYQARGKENVGCDPEDFPTKDYIERHKEAYTNPNLTVWGGTPAQGGYEQYWPRNRLYDDGKGCEAAPRKYPGKLRTGSAADFSNVNVAMQDDPAIKSSDEEEQNT